MTQPQPGDIMFGPIGGAAGVLVGLGQVILGEVLPDHWEVRHAAVVTFNYKIVQAMPGGAEEVPLTNDQTSSAKYVFVRPAYLTGSQAWEVAHAAQKYIGTPYSFADYAAIAGLHLGFRNGRIRRYVTTSKHMICSQLADQAMSDAGWHVFDDGRLSQDVTPGALYDQMTKMPGKYWIAGKNADFRDLW